jgi:hypothetical protein
MLLSPSKINKHLGKNSGVKGWLYAIAGGIFISGPPYILYPMLGELKKHGARNGLLAAMLIYYFNLRYAVILSIYIILFSILNGILLEFIVSENE